MQFQIAAIYAAACQALLQRHPATSPQDIADQGWDLVEAVQRKLGEENVNDMVTAGFMAHTLVALACPAGVFRRGKPPAEAIERAWEVTQCMRAKMLEAQPPPPPNYQPGIYPVRDDDYDDDYL